MAAQLQYNPDHSGYQVIVGDESWCHPIEEDGDGIAVLAGVDETFVVIFEDADYPGLRTNTVYQLVPVTTILVEEAELAFDDEEDEEDDDDDEGEPVEA